MLTTDPTLVDPGTPTRKSDSKRAGSSHGPAKDKGLEKPPISQCFSQWTVVYLAGEIHSEWRHEIAEEAKKRNLPVRFTHPVLNHSASDQCGVAILGQEPDLNWVDHKGAKINAIRTRTLIGEAEIVVARFDGELTYRQWNAAFEAGQAAALGKALIVLRDEGSRHALKEVDAAALAVAKTSEQVVDILSYVITGQLPAK